MISKMLWIMRLHKNNGSGKQYLDFLESISVTCKYLVKSNGILQRIIDTGKKEHNYFNFFNI